MIGRDSSALDNEARASGNQSSDGIAACRAKLECGVRDRLLLLELAAACALIDVGQHAVLLVVADVGARRKPPGEKLLHDKVGFPTRDSHHHLYAVLPE